MLDKILAQIAVGIIDALLKRIEAGSIAVDADMDRDRLRRAGSRIDEWLRQQDGIHSRGQPNQDGTKRPS
jgi:hypothetical protein